MARIKPLSFGIAPNSLLNNKNISLSAKGMYTYMNSKPENWEFFDRKQRETFENYQNDIEKNGYIKQINKIAVLNQEDFENKREKIESNEGFVEWLN